MSEFMEYALHVFSLYEICFYTFNEDLERHVHNEIENVMVLLENVILSAGSNKLELIMADIHKLKHIIDLKYTGTLQDWQLSSVKRSEE
jgi:hypothetical protein